MKPTHVILRDLREGKDVKQTAVAELLGMSQQQYSRYETGDSELPLRFLPTLVDYYGVSVEYIVGIKDALYGVPGLDMKVTGNQTIGEVMSDILSLGAVGRDAVVEYIYLQQLKERYGERKDGDGQ
ncbi:MAG: helix-turn-helix domain-containing protein [Defluviitaleaceae bacterium]|nr:helix-turn-helix domain-containing protein [Defluviitaleaceae bacterium]